MILRWFRRRALAEQIRTSLWVLPSLLVATAGVAAAMLAQIELDQSSPLAQLVFPGGAESARGILQAIAGSVITVTGVVFSLTVVTLQLASTQFSPRLLRTFLRDFSNQVVLGTFLATFTYALVVLRGVESRPAPEDDVVPTLAVTGAYFLTAASVVALVYFIDHIARSIRIDSLLREVNEDTANIIDDIYPRGDGNVVAPGSVPRRPAGASSIAATRSGFVQAVDDDCLLDAAERAGVVLQLEPAIGDHVVAGSPVAWVWSAGGGRDVEDDVRAAVGRAVRVGYERTMQQDVAFGFRQLVDVAVKALSPGVNDPTTAVHALGHLAALLVLLAAREVGPKVRTDDAGTARVVLPGLDLAGYLDLACGQVRRYGSSEPSVIVELLRMLRDVARCDLGPLDAAAVEREASMAVAAAERSTADSRDLDPVHDVHRQILELLSAPAS